MGIFKNKKYYKQDDCFDKKDFTIGTELVQITDRLIDELNEEFREKFNRSSKREMAIPLNKEDGKKEIEEMLLGYIKDAVAKRAEISKRIAESILNGAVYQQYYKRMDEVSSRTVSVYKKLHEMEAAEDDYLFQKNVYKQLLGNAFIEIEESPKKEKKQQEQMMGEVERTGDLDDGGTED